MADETIIIDVQFKSNDVAKKLGQVNKEINELTDANRVLRNEIKNGNDIMGENSLKLAENESKLKTLNSEKRNYLGIVEEEIRDNKSYGTSINDLRDRLRSLTATYNALSKEERNSQFGKNIQDAAKKTQEEISKLNQNIGNYRDNVGNYKSAFLDFFSKVGGKWKDLGKIFTSNPIGIAITALVLIFNKLKESFEKGDAAGQKLKASFAGLKPIIEGVENLLSGIVSIITSIINVASDLFSIFNSGTSSVNSLSSALKNYAEILAEANSELKKLKYEEDLIGSTGKLNKALSEQYIKTIESEVVGIKAKKIALNSIRQVELDEYNQQQKISRERYDINKREFDSLIEISKLRKEEYEKQKNAYENLVKRYGEYGLSQVLVRTDMENANQRYLESLDDIKQKEIELNNIQGNIFELKANYINRQSDYRKWELAIIKQEADSLYKLNDAENTYAKNKITIEAQISELRKKSENEEQYTFEQRAAFLDQAIKLEEEDLRERVKLAQKRLDYEKYLAEETEDESLATANKIKSLERELLKEKNNYNLRVAELEEERIATTKKNLKTLVEQTEALEKQASDAAIDAMIDGRDKEIAKLEMSYAEELDMLKKKEDEIKKILEQANTLGYNISESDLAKLNQQLDDIAALRILKETELQNSLLNIKKQYSDTELQAEFTAIENKYAMEIQLSRRKEVELADIDSKIAKEYRQYLEGLTQEQIDSLFISEQAYQLALVTAMQEEEAAIERRNQLLANHVEKTLSAMNNLLGSVSSLFDAFDAESESSKNAQKAIAVAQFAFSSAAALAKGISEASAAGPFPYNLAAIATTVATILANLAAARKLFNEKSSGYESGGIVPGTSYTGDRITANVNSGEMILTREQQKALFRMANTNLATNNNYDLLVSGLSEALKNQPSPVLNYEEFTNFSNDVANKNKLILK